MKLIKTEWQCAFGKGWVTFFINFSHFLIGFDDAFRAIERLSMYVFDLPVDVAVKQFKDMNEAFWKYKKRRKSNVAKNPLFLPPFIITFPKAKPLIFSLEEESPCLLPKKLKLSHLKFKGRELNRRFSYLYQRYIKKTILKNIQLPLWYQDHTPTNHFNYGRHILKDSLYLLLSKNLYIWKKKTTTIISPIAIIDANTTINKEPGNTFAISMYTHK